MTLKLQPDPTVFKNDLREFTSRRATHLGLYDRLEDGQVVRPDMAKNYELAVRLAAKVLEKGDFKNPNDLMEAVNEAARETKAEWSAVQAA